MAYSDFTLTKVRKELKVQISEDSNLFGEIEPVQPSAFLRATLIGTEKAKSEFLIAPVLAEVRDCLDNRISLFSGSSFNVDADLGLQGPCDFILSDSPEQLDVTAPVVAIAEAKNDSLKSGFGQCIAEMVAAQIFNDREGTPRPYIYGVVTNGTTWRFLRLKQQQVQIDQVEYFINQVDRILGILLQPFQGK
jgi:hypothetical protein